MRRILLTLAAIGILCVVPSQAQAHGPHVYYRGPAVYYRYRAPVAVYPRVVSRPPVVAPLPVYPRAVYPRVYGYPCYRPYSGLYYYGPGFSIGVGF